MKDALTIFGAFVVGAAAAGAVVYIAAKRTRDDLTGAGAQMQAAFEQAGRMTQRELQTQADAFARQIATVGQAKIQAAAASTALQVTYEYGITPQLIADARAAMALYASARTNPFTTLARYA